MKKILSLVIALFVCLPALLAQTTREQADAIVLEYLMAKHQDKRAQFSGAGVMKSLQTSVTINTLIPTTQTLIVNETLELDYPCWVYIIIYLGHNYFLIVKESNGSLLEINTTGKSAVVPNSADQITGSWIAWEPVNIFNTECSECIGKEIIEVLEDELVTIAFEPHLIMAADVDSLFFYTEQHKCLYPCYDQVPLEYRESGLKVRISGNVTNCDPRIYAPHAMMTPGNIFELTSIKKEEE